MSKNKFFKKLLVAGLCALTATATIGGVVACKKDKDKDDTEQNQTQEHNITWNLDGGKWPDGYTAPTKVTDGEKITAPTQAQNPTKSGNEFVRWESTAVPGTAYDFNVAPEGDVSLKAIWNPTGTPGPGETTKYTVTIDLKGGSWEGQTVKDGKIVLEVAKNDDLTDLYAVRDKLANGEQVYDKLVIKGQTTAYDWTEAITGNLELEVLWKIPHKHAQSTTLAKDANGHWYPCTNADGDCDDVNAAYPDTKSVHHDANHDGVCDDECGYTISNTLTGTNVKFKELVDEAANTGNDTALILAETFLESKEEKLAEFDNWGTAGLTQGHKSNASADEYVEIKDNKATLVTDTKGATYLYADFGSVNAVIIKGYFEISSVYGSNTYTPVQFTSSDNSEPIGLRSGTGAWGYRKDGDVVTGASAGTWANGGKVYFEYDTTTNKISITVDGVALATNVQLSKSISGIKFSSGDSNDSTYAVNNIVLVKTPVDISAYKATIQAKVDAAEALLPEGLKGGDAKTTYESAITSASTPENCDAIYKAYYDAKLAAYKTYATTHKNTDYPAGSYTKEQNSGAYKTVVTDTFVPAIEGADTLEKVKAAIEALDDGMVNIFNDTHYDQETVTITIAGGLTGSITTKRPGEKLTAEDIDDAVTVPEGSEITGYYEDVAMTATPITLPWTITGAKTIYVKVEVKTVNDYEAWFVEKTADEGATASSTTYAKDAVIYDNDNTLFTLSAGVASKYSIGKEKGTLQTSGHATTFTDQKGNTYNPDQGICLSSGVAKCTCDTTTGDITAPGTADNLYKVTAKEDCTVYLYLSMTNDSFNSNRPGTITYTIGNGNPVSQEWKADRGAVVALAITLKAGETATIGVTCSSVSKDSKTNEYKANSANLWLFGAEAVKKGVTITPPATGDEE